MNHLSSETFKESAKAALADVQLRGALKNATSLFGERRKEAAASLPREARKIALSRLGPGVSDDLAAIARRAKKEDPRVHRAVARVDEYLRSTNGVDAAPSYHRTIALILSPPLRELLSTYGTPNK